MEKGGDFICMCGGKDESFISSQRVFQLSFMEEKQIIMSKGHDIE